MAQKQRLTAGQRKALTLIERTKGGAPITSDRKGVSPYMAHLLIARGWATRSSDVLLITKAGRAEVNAPLPPQPQEYLHKDGMRLTTRRDLAARDEPAVMKPPDPRWRERAEARRRADLQDTQATRLTGLDHPEERLSELRRLAAMSGVDVSDEERFVQRAVRAYERKVRRSAA